jgi:hypothetical protein
MFYGHFTVYSIQVPRQKLRSLNRVKEALGIPKDPPPTNRIVRRVDYQTDGPRSVLHIGGYHKGKE